MPTHIAIPLEDDYLIPSSEIIEQLSKSKAAPQAEKTVKTVRILIDHMFELMLDGMIEQVDLKPFAQKLITQVSSLVHKAVNVLVKKVVGKLNNEELDPLVNHFKAHEFKYQGAAYLGYQLEPRIEALIESCIAHLENDNIEEAKSELIEILEDVIENSLDVFMLHPMSLIKLGLVARKLVGFTHTTIDKAVPPALHKIVDHMEKPQLLQLKDFLLQFLIEK